MWTSLTTYVPQVQKRVCPTAPFGVSLRLSNASATTLVKSKPERDKLKSFLADNDMYLYTVNAFPYGPFKNQIVKEQVYEPDWRSEERTQYTMNVADILADVVPAGISPSIQSAPLGFKPQRHRQGRDRQLHRACHAGGGAPDRPGKAHRPHRDPGARARAVLLPRDHRRDGRLLHQPSLHRQIRRDAGEALRPADLGSDRRAAPLHRHRVRHLPPGGGVRGHRRVAAEARRRRHSDLQAAGSGRHAHSRT